MARSTRSPSEFCNATASSSWADVSRRLSNKICVILMRTVTPHPEGCSTTLSQALKSQQAPDAPDAALTCSVLGSRASFDSRARGEIRLGVIPYPANDFAEPSKRPDCVPLSAQLTRVPTRRTLVSDFTRTARQQAAGGLCLWSNPIKTMSNIKLGEIRSNWAGRTASTHE